MPRKRHRDAGRHSPCALEPIEKSAQLSVQVVAVHAPEPDIQIVAFSETPAIPFHVPAAGVPIPPNLQRGT